MSRKHTGSRWTCEIAGSEFNINPRTLANRLRQFGILAGEDGKFTTLQICSAVFGDIDSEKLRLTKVQADKIEMENEVERGKFIHRDAFVEWCGKFLASAKARIYSNQKLDAKEKDSLVEIIGRCLEVGGGDAAGDNDPAAEIHRQPVE